MGALMIHDLQAWIFISCYVQMSRNVERLKDPTVVVRLVAE
jgi:hypothetical protein